MSSSSPHPGPSPKGRPTHRGRLRDTLRELAEGVDSRGIGRLFNQEAPTALRQLAGEHKTEAQRGTGLRRAFGDVRDVLVGLLRRLSPPRRLLFAAALVAAGLGAFDLELVMKKDVHVDSSPFWFLVAITSLLLLLALELVDRVRVRDEIEVARVLQRDLLPKEVHPPAGWRISHQYCTANEIGGDYYDFLPLEDGRFAFAIGDASGHGIGAGLLMTITSVSLGAALEVDPSPKAVLASVNRILCRTGGSRAFATLFYGLLDPQTGILEWANAGHPFPLLRRASGEVIELGRGSLPLGLRRKGTWASESTRIEPGDLLVLYSDGIPEARGKTGDFGFDRLRGLVARGGLPGDLLARIWHELMSHLGEENLRDDATLVLLGWDPLPPPPPPPIPPPPPLPDLPPLPPPLPR